MLTALCVIESKSVGVGSSALIPRKPLGRCGEHVTLALPLTLGLMLTQNLVSIGRTQFTQPTHLMQQRQLNVNLTTALPVLLGYNQRMCKAVMLGGVPSLMEVLHCP